MSKRAIRLHRQHSREKLVAMQRALLSDPHYQRKDGSLHLLTKAGQKLHDDIGWALYWHDAPKGNTHMQREPAQGRWW